MLYKEMPKMWRSNDKSIKGEKKDMKNTNETNEVEKIKNYLKELGFICDSHPTSQNLIYSKKNDVIIIKNKKREVDMK